MSTRAVFLPMLMLSQWKKKQNPRRLLPLKGQKRLANIFLIRISKKKAGLIVCFFLSTTISFAAPDQVWQFSDEMQKAYRLVLNLQPDKAQEILGKITSPAEELHKIYVLSFSETVNVLIIEDQKRFDQLEINFRQRLQLVDNLPESAEKLFLEAELNLQKGFNLLNMGQNLNAVLAILRPYTTAQECIKKYPA